MLLPILFILITVIFIYLNVIRPYSTWVRRGVKQTNPPYLFGDNSGQVLGYQSFYDMSKNLYNSFPEEKYFGTYQMTTPALMIRDPELIKTIAIKDFDYFINHRQFIPDGVESMWSKNLVSLKNSEWKQMRTTLTPAFTSNKMRSIFNLIDECSNNYTQYFKTHKHKEIEFRNLATKYTNDLIASVAFGIKCDSLNEPDNDFLAAALSINASKSWRLVAFFGYTVFPVLFKVLNVPVFPRKAINFFKQAVKDTIKVRERKGIVRPDMIQLLMETKMKNVSDEDMAAQAFIFYLGGFETVASTIFLLGHCLATHPNVQRKLQNEIDATLSECNGRVTYEALLKMKYLDMVVSETLRMWPSLPSLDRICNKTYTLPPSNEKGKPINIYPGELLLFPIMAMHYDPEYFPNPNEWNPERFSDENKDKIHPYAYLPFGLGPRNCIGSRLALLEIKLFFFHLLFSFNLIKNEKTVDNIRLSNRSFTMNTDHDLWVGLEERKK